jgi:hypothetical protein
MVPIRYTHTREILGVQYCMGTVFARGSQDSHLLAALELVQKLREDIFADTGPVPSPAMETFWTFWTCAQCPRN